MIPGLGRSEVVMKFTQIMIYNPQYIYINGLPRLIGDISSIIIIFLVDILTISHYIPVVPHKAVAEVSKIGNL